MRNRVAVISSSSFLAIAALPASAQNQVWIRQLGVPGVDIPYAAALDGSGGVYLGGLTGVNIGGPNSGSLDAWIARYDSMGQQIWIRQFGTSAADVIRASAPDGSGGLFVSGYTMRNLGGPCAGGSDAWLARYDGAGGRMWIRQLGTSVDDGACAMASGDSGSVYVSGATWGSLGGTNAGAYDAWIARYDSFGNQTWVRQFGTSGNESASAAAPDGAGGVYIAGVTSGSLGGQNANPYGLAFDAWLACYDSAGNQTWIRQFGTGSDEYTTAAAPDGSGGVYLAGSTNGSLGGPSAGVSDAWLARYDGAGSRSWIRQFGSSTFDTLAAAASTGSIGVCVTGLTRGNLGGPSAGADDAWLAQFDGAGKQMWLIQLGTSSSDEGDAIASDGSGHMFVCGATYGNLAGQNAGHQDVWLARYDGCGFSTFCTAGTTSHLCVPSIGGSGTPSATAPSGFTVTISSVEGLKSGLLFYGMSNANWSPTPWANGSTSLLCVKAPTQRTPIENSGGTFAACDGVLAIDWNTFVATHPGALGTPFIGGETIWAQGWFRDPLAPRGSNLSDGLVFVAGP